MNLGIAEKINLLTKQGVPFVFIIDFDGEKAFVVEESKIDCNKVLYSINGLSNYKEQVLFQENPVSFVKHPISLKKYSKAFKFVKKNIEKGNSYLTNLTFETPIDINLSLKEVFYKSKSPYKLWFKDEFVVFSPEIFVKIIDGRIYSFPMKGTIDASQENAEQTIINDRKETAEHATIVDLIRNDLSRVSTGVKVDKYRYIDTVKTNQGELLQVSSKISGYLPENYNEKLGDILFNLLPAGSISGAPKSKTLEIIKNAENYKRGYYTGIFGRYDGKNLDSAVAIRFIENKKGQLVFKSGGGITVNSNLNDEYSEMISKVYLPF